MSGTNQYPSTPELREWARSRPGGAGVQAKGMLPKFVILAWNRAHPDRPYVASQAYHGTLSGYDDRNCRCDRCSEAKAAYDRDTHLLDTEEANDLAADALLGGAR